MTKTNRSHLTLRLESTLLEVHQWLQRFALSNSFFEILTQAMGQSFSREQAQILQQQWRANNFSALPQIEIRTQAELQSAKAAYATDTNTIYLSEQFLAHATDTDLTATLLEEVGHFVDAKINSVDTPGDEGAIFSTLIRQKRLDVQVLESLRKENDSATFILDGQPVRVEQATVSDSGGFEGSLKTLKLETPGGGRVQYSYEFYPIPDQFIFRYEGKEILNTGFVSGPGSGQVEIPQGTSDELQIIVATNDEDTAWEYTVESEGGCPETHPLIIELVGGEFEDTDGDGDCDGQGTILVGVEGGISRMLRIENATAEYDENELRVTGGTVFAEIGNISEPLFQGDLVIPYSTLQATVQEVDRADDFELGGLETDFTSIALKPEGISLGSNFTLPDSLLFKGLLAEDRKVSFSGADSLFIGNRGIGFGSEVGKIPFPTTKEFKPFDLFGIYNLGAEIQYLHDERKLKVQGNFKVQDLSFFDAQIGGVRARESSAELDLTDDNINRRENFIQVQDGIADIQGTLKLRNIPLSFNFEFEELDLELETQNGQLVDINAKAKVLFPLRTKKGLEGEAGFKRVNGSFELDEIGFGLDNLDLPVPLTPIFLQRVAGSLRNLAPDNVPTSYKGELGFSFLKEITFTPPRALSSLLDPITASIVRVDGDFESNELFYTGTGNLKFISSQLLEINGQFTWDTGKKVIEASGAANVLGGLGTGQADLKINYYQGGGLSLFGNSALKIPDLPVFFGFRGKELAGGSAQVVAKFDDNFSNDYLAAWGNVSIPFVGQRTFGFQIFADGGFNIIGAKNIPPQNSLNLQSASNFSTLQSRSFNLASSQTIASGNNFAVETGTEWILLSATWENVNNGDVTVRVITPNGTAIEESEFAANNIAVVDDLTSTKAKTVVVANPTPGAWDLEVINPAGLDGLQIVASRNDNVPTIEITSPTMDVAGSNVNLSFNAFDPDSNAEIKLFYDDDNQGFNGIQFAEGISENDGAGNFTWNTQGVAPGEYFIYAQIQDGTNAPIFSYSQGRVIVTDEADISVTQTTSASPVTGGGNFSYLVTVTNNSALLSQGIVLEQTLPEAVTFVSSNVVPFAQAGNVLSFGLGDLAAGESRTIEIAVTPPNDLTELTSTAAIASSTFDPNSANDVSTLTLDTEAGFPDLAVIKTGVVAPVALGQNFSLDFQVTNNGTKTATGVELVQNLPSGISYVRGQASQGNIAQEIDGKVRASLGNLAVGETATVSIALKPFVAGILVTTTTIDSNETDSRVIDNSLIEVQVVGSSNPAAADLELTQAVSDTVAEGDETITFTLTLTNKGPGTASGVQVTNLLPRGLSFVSARTVQGDYDSATGIWDVGNLRDGLSRNLTITARVTGIGAITNVAEVTGVRELDPDSTPGNNVLGEDDQTSVTLLGVPSLDAFGTAPSPINFRQGKPGVNLRGSNRNNRLNGTRNKDILRGLNGNDRLNGKGDNDRLSGGNGKDTLLGGKQRDLLLGNAGDDILKGESGADILVGGGGDDTLIGGGGQDLFVLNQITNSRDRIIGFNRTEDLIDLRSIFSSSRFSGSSRPAQFVQYVQLVQVGANTEIRLDADGKGAGTDFKTLATLTKEISEKETTV